MEGGIAEGAAYETLDLGDRGPRVRGGGGTEKSLVLSERDDGGGFAAGLAVEKYVDPALASGGNDEVLIPDIESYSSHLPSSPRILLPPHG